MNRLCRDDLVVGVSTSHHAHVVGHGFAPRLRHTKHHHKNYTNCLPVWHAGWVVCGTAYGDMHYKDLLGPRVRVGYCISPE